MQHESKLGVQVAAGGDFGAGAEVGVGLKNRWRFECFDKHGNLKWTEEVDNLVVNEGLDHALESTLGGGTQITAWFVGLVDNAGFTAYAATDTAAQINGSNGWSEFINYTEANRPACTFGATSGQSIDNSASKAVFSINAAGTVNGAFLVSNSTKAGTGGTLYGEATFTSGTKAVDNGDTLNVTVTATAAAV